jgi:hypothetical protein
MRQALKYKDNKCGLLFVLFLHAAEAFDVTFGRRGGAEQATLYQTIHNAFLCFASTASGGKFGKQNKLGQKIHAASFGGAPPLPLRFCAVRLKALNQ